MSLTESLPSLGETSPSGELEHLLGTEREFPHWTVGTARPRAIASNMLVHARWVKNETGGALLPGNVCTWDTGSTYGPGKAVIAEATSGTNTGIGVVDPHLPAAGVADNDHFWLIERGPCQFRSTTGTAVAIDDTLATGATGRVTVYDETTATAAGNRDRCGKALEAVGAGAASDTLFNGFADFRF